MLLASKSEKEQIKRNKIISQHTFFLMEASVERHYHVINEALMKPILQLKTVLTKRNEKSLHVWRRQTHVHVVILQVVAAVIAGLLLGVREHSEGLAHLLKLLLFLFLHFSTRSAMSVCERYKRDCVTESGRKKTLGLSYTLVLIVPREQTSGEFEKTQILSMKYVPGWCIRARLR